MPGGFGGFAFTGQGYTQGGQDWQRLQAMETDQQALAALGRAMQGGAPPGGAGAGRSSIFSAPLPPPPGATAAPSMGGGPPSFPGAIQMGAPAGGPPPPGPSFTPYGAPGGAPPPGMGGGPPGMGAPPGGMPSMGMSWQDIATKVVQANPGAPPEVIAAAVSKAMPLMAQDSQMQWRQIQTLLAQERIDTQRMGQEQRGQQFQEREDRLRDQFASREKLSEGRLQLAKDRELRTAQEHEEAARQKATALEQKDRAAAIADWYKKAQALSRLQQQKINALTNLTGKDKKDMLQEVEQQKQQIMEDYNTMMRGNSAAPSGAGDSFGSRFGASGTTGAAPAAGAKPMTPDDLTRAQQFIQQHPDKKAQFIQELKKQGYDVGGL